jgi:hypothetical protein
MRSLDTLHSPDGYRELGFGDYLETGQQDDPMPRRRLMPLLDLTLDAAVDLYCSAFGRDGLPCLAGLEDEARSIAAAMLASAVRTNRPLRYCAIADALGGLQPPQGGSL